MKILQTILALLALIALMAPCAHAEENHQEMPAAELCATDHAACHACSDEPCSDAPTAVLIVSALQIPAPRLQILCELKPEHESFTAVVPLLGALSHLQTVQLLI